MNLYAFCANNPVRYIDPSGHIKDWVTPSSNYDLESIYSSDILQAEKNRLLNVDIIEVENSDIKNFMDNKPSGDDVITIKFNLDGDTALRNNKNGSKAMVNSFRSKAKNRLKKMPLTGSVDAWSKSSFEKFFG